MRVSGPRPEIGDGLGGAVPTTVGDVVRGLERVRVPVVLGRDALLAQQRWVLFGLLVLLNLADVVTTGYVLALGGVETNPLVKPIVDNLWAVSALKAAVLALVGALLVRCAGSRLAEVALVVATGWYLAVVSWNITVLALI